MDRVPKLSRQVECRSSAAKAVVRLFPSAPGDPLLIMLIMLAMLDLSLLIRSPRSWASSRTERGCTPPNPQMELFQTWHSSLQTTRLC